jgi:hypothetical protein
MHLFACPEYLGPPFRIPAQLDDSPNYPISNHSVLLLCLAQDQAPVTFAALGLNRTLAAPQGSFSDCSGIFETSMMLVCI